MRVRYFMVHKIIFRLLRAQLNPTTVAVFGVYDDCTSQFAYILVSCHVCNWWAYPLGAGNSRIRSTCQLTGLRG